MILALVLASALDAERAIQLANAWKLDEAHAAANAAFVDALACADVDARARALDALGVVARLRGNAVGALDFTSEAIAIASDVDTLARSRNDLGRIHSDLLGDVAAAREEHELVLTLDVRDQRIHVRALNNLGNLAMAEQDLVTARRFYDRAAKLAARAEDEEGALAAEHNIGLALMMAGEPRDALARFARAEEMDRRRGSAQRARILLSRSEAERALGNPHAALSLLREARSSRDFVTSAIVALREADLHIEQRELARAEETLRTARTLATRLRDPSLIALELAYRAKLRLAQARFGEAAELAARAAKTGTLDVVAQASAIAGTAQRRRGNRAAAKRFYRDAIAAIEQQRVRVSTSIDTRLRFFERETFPYVAMVELSDDASEALEFAEAAKARVLREQRPRRAQSSNATFVEYLVTDSVLYAFVVRDSVTMHKIPISRADLDALTQRFARELALRNLGFRATAQALYDILLAPLSLRDGERLCIVPDQELWRVAFHALVDGADRYLIQTHEIAYAPARSVTLSDAKGLDGRDPSLSAQLRMTRVMLASALDEAAQEIAEIRGVWGADRTNVVPAKEQLVRNAAPRYGIVHIAAHGVYDAADPMQSHLVLDDELLTARELRSLKLPSSLVVLSACETGVGRPAAGEGLVGMSWALLLAGARAVIAGTWEVDSESTARLMIALHRRLANGDAPAAALRGAQLALLREHPFYWAGFSLVGSGW